MSAQNVSNVPHCEHEHSFLTHPDRCFFCGVTSEELRRQSEHAMLVAAFIRLADVLDKVEAKL